MLIKNRLFLFAALTAIIQQIILAASTWNIAMAGGSVGEGDFQSAKTQILLFFGLATVAYVTSSIGEIFLVKSQNQIWHKYTLDTIHKFCSDLRLSSESNRKSVSQWIASEALSTIHTAAPFYLSLISTVLNIVLTTAVFFFSLGFLVGCVVGAALIVSLLLVGLAKPKIERFANEAQSNKLSTLLHIDTLIANGHFGTSAMARSQSSSFSSKASKLYQSTERYNNLEQIIACTPIILSVLSVSFFVYFLKESSLIELGILVALLPRTLQLFGNIHSLSSYLSNLFLMNRKIQNLHNFIPNLESQNLEQQVNRSAITITNKSSFEEITIDDLTKLVTSRQPAKGRILIAGENGSGKSSLLKMLKMLNESSVLLTPGAKFNGDLLNLSTGQLQIKELKSLLASPEKIILLDEWDANLDTKNRQACSAIIDQISAAHLVVEVRHTPH
ncbi:hypothetical protein [Pseudomonas putida]|uniref:hypothetical protein n=1 Tax=Pseudomonas putida TaxID=303 RepID=UPI0018D8171B|nr:hypothetical protein [Pseudomonas putida]MBH3460735.1 hypothetical protein [Pseudomonas putida]